MAHPNALRAAPDEALGARAASDFDAFAELYGRHLDGVYRFVRSQVGDDAAAEDLTAQVFFKALTSAATFRGDGSYRSWLFRIAHNTIVTWRGRRDRSPLAVEEVPETAGVAPSAAMHVIAREDRDAVWLQVARLPAAQREVVALRYLDDLSVEEIARIVGRTRGSVRILLHRARARLRHTLGGADR